ncbi:MAG: TIGR04283 family arsenosugar biosynthesis glycosyltransferase [Casimicrobiaceae bacterium]
MRLSIVVPALDEGATIGATLAGLQALRGRGDEVIVVDGGSADATMAVARPLADRVLTAPRGRALQMNAGAAAASGEILVFLHADTILTPVAANAMRAALTRGRWQWGRFNVRIDAGGGSRGDAVALRVVAAAMNLRSCITGIATGDQAIFVTRAAFARTGGFPVQPLMEDITLSGVLNRVAGRPFCCDHPVTTSGRRWRQHGVVRTITRMWWLRLRYWRGDTPERLARDYPAHRVRPCVVQVFAKAPVAGKVKTRLAPAIGIDQAAEVHAQMVERTLQVAVAARNAGAIDAIELWCDPDTSHPAFQAWSTIYGVALCSQRGADLGARMEHALAQALAAGQHAILVGTDCPVLATAHLAQARRALQAHDAVFMPTEDGGYALVGLARSLPIFHQVPWSTMAVMAVTRARLATAAAHWHELETVWDLDRPEDLARWRAGASPASTAS